VRAHRRSGGQPRALGIRGRGGDAGLHDRRAHRADRAAPARHAALRALPRPGDPAPRRGGRRLRDRDARARRLPRERRRGRPGDRAPRLRRSARTRTPPNDVRDDPRVVSAHAGRAGRDGDRDRRRCAADVPRGVVARRARRSHHARGCDGQADCDGERAARRRPDGAAVRRARAHARIRSRTSLPRDPRSAHLRRSQRSATARHRPAGARVTAHVDPFARENLPPREEWPEFLFTLPGLQYPARLNCAAELLDVALARGCGDRPAIVDASGMLTYGQLASEVNRIAGMLRDDLHLVPGNRLLLRGFNNAVTAACWLAAVKAGLVVVTTMPLLRAKELTDVVNAAQIAHALCDVRLRDELEAALPACPTLREIVFTHDDGPRGLTARTRDRTAVFDACDTAADDVCMIAFTSGTTGRPKGTMHFHRDVLAVCDTFPPSSFAPTPDDVFIGTPPLAFTYGLGAALLFPLRAGASTVLIEKPSPEALLGAIRDHGATVCFTAPTSYRAMAPLVERDRIRTLRACVSAGETLPVAMRALWENATGVLIIDGIGSTEMLHIFIAASGDEIRPGATGKP